MNWVKEPQKIESYDHCSFHGYFTVNPNENGTCSVLYCITRFCIFNFT